MKYKFDGVEWERSSIMDLDDFCGDSNNYSRLCDIYREKEEVDGSREDSHKFTSWCYEYATPIMEKLYLEFIIQG